MKNVQTDKRPQKRYLNLVCVGKHKKLFTLKNGENVLKKKMLPRQSKLQHLFF